ncbi:ParA family protein [Vibrio parahaemolyticus]|nr:ParA family protein [Vibrio parahaemolyticus]
MTTQTVDLKQIYENIDSHQFTSKGDDESEKVKFRTYKRAEFFKACGVSSTTALSNKLAELSKTHEETHGEPLEIGYQPTPKGHYEYTLNEVYKIIDLCRQVEKLAKKRGKFKVQKKFRRNRARIIAVANQKGGAGKSTAAMHIAVGQAIMDFAEARVLIVDYDPQGTVHSFVEGTYISLTETKTLCRYLMNEYIDEHESNEPGADLNQMRRDFLKKEIIRPTHIPNLDYCVALTKDNALEGHLAQLEFSAMDELDINTFNEDLQGSNVYHIFQERFVDLIAEDYDFIIIDSAPHNNTFIKAMLYAVEELVVTSPTKAMDFESTCNFLKSTFEAFDEFKMYDEHPGLPNLTMLPIMYSGTENARNLLIDYQKIFGNYVYPFPITQKHHLYETMSSDSLTIYSYSSDLTPTMKDAKSEWDKINDYIRVNASRDLVTEE